MMNKGMGIRYSLALCAALMVPKAHAVLSDEQFIGLTESVVDQHVLPRYQALAASSKALSTRVSALCAAKPQASLAEAQQAFIAALQDWQQVQHIQFGPVTLLMRNYSMQYWPDKKNLGGKQLRAALADTNAVYDAAYLQHASIALKGFSAMERLLFTKHAQQLTSGTPTCRLSDGIAQHIATSSAAIVSEWAAERDGMLNASEDSDYYESPEEAATVLFKALVEPVEAIRDSKILAPLGETYDKARWTRSESWRSDQSVANMVSNVLALQALYQATAPVSIKGLLHSVDAPLAAAISEQFAAALAALQAVPQVEGKTVSKDAYDQLKVAERALRTLQNSLLAATRQLDIQLGFNSRDGD